MSPILKKYAAGLLVGLFCISAFSAPLKSRGAIILAIVAVVAVVDYVSCDVNIVWGCHGGGFGGGRGGGGVQSCTSSANGCGMTNSGRIVGGACNATTPSNTQCPTCTSGQNACGQTNSGNILGGTCSASTPPNSSCPAPAFGGDSAFFAQPSTIGVGMSTTLNWSVTNATECSVTGDNGFSALHKPITGSISTGVVSVSTTFTITCQNGNGGPQGSKSIRVIVDPHFKEI
jgi:hypothetical protein